MSETPPRVRIAPRTLGEILDASFQVYRKGFVRLLVASLTVNLPVIVVAALFAGDAANAMTGYMTALETGMRPNPQEPFRPLMDLMHAMSGLTPLILLTTVLNAVSRAGVACAMVPAALAAVRREPIPSLSAIFKMAAPRFPAVLVTQFIFDASWGFLACCCLPLGLWVSVVFAPAAAIVVLERGPLEASMRRALPRGLARLLAPFAAATDAIVRGLRLSWSFSVSARGSVVVFFLLTFVAVFDGAITTPLSLLDKHSGSWFWAQQAAEALFLPVFGLGRVMWYFDLLARREGADLEPAT